MPHQWGINEKSTKRLLDGWHSLEYAQLCWCGTVIRVDQGGWGWVGNERNGGQEGLEGTNTDQHNEESKAFGHQRQMDSIRWPAPDCGLERMRAIVGWMGSVTGIMQLSSRTGPPLLSSLHNDKIW
ncbi:hypothetical protein N7517_003059 [Penicillium concentricum]|uniref:Uncharacterized protein n=1 Tax=Penicillium concentricum TaxID=293559 RepID=A0A9W9VK30_9EURO|nr:uncharacterized protein N7517_003059 [Penicillium concentricum]KAJ5385148.1 hypothetical protein N7517_003059 [Penicillium concentricum]